MSDYSSDDNSIDSDNEPTTPVKVVKKSTKPIEPSADKTDGEESIADSDSNADFSEDDQSDGEEPQQPAKTVDDEDANADADVDPDADDTEPAQNTIREILVYGANRKYSDQLTLFEQTRLIGERGAQIGYNGGPFVEVTDEDTGIAIAKMELMNRKMPLIVRRKSEPVTLPNGETVIYVEDWDPNTMHFAKTY